MRLVVGGYEGVLMVSAVHRCFSCPVISARHMKNGNHVLLLQLEHEEDLLFSTWMTVRTAFNTVLSWAA